MTTQYINQAVSYSDGVNTLTLNPNVGLQITDGTTTLTSNTTGFTNGVQSLLFSDLYAGVQKTESIQYATSTATTLNIQDTIFIDKVGFTPTTTIDNDSITIIGGGGFFGTSSLGYDGLSIEDNTNTISVVSTPTEITLSSGITSNTLTATNWSGNYQSVNTTTNITHYLNFSDASGTGYGKSQKTTGITCNPSTKTITATTFIGALSGLATNASNIAITSDNTSGAYYIPFSKLSAGTNPLYIDDTTSPLTYNPSTGIMTSLYYSGDEIRPITQNLATYAGSTLSVSGASNGQNVSSRNSSIVISGGSGNINALTLTNMVVNGTYKIGILNSSGSNLTINTGLGANIRTLYSGGFNVSSGRYALMTIDVIVINGGTQYIVNATQLTN
jgi:hypothetical protein